MKKAIAIRTILAGISAGIITLTLMLGITLLTGCVSAPVVKKTVDHSYPVLSGVTETGALTYTKEGLSSKNKKAPADGEIIAYGQIKAPGEPSGIMRIGAYPQKNKNIPEHILLLAEKYHALYKWNGDILFADETYKANIVLDAECDTISGDGDKIILLDSAKTDYTSFEFSGVIGSWIFFEASPESGAPTFPWWVGDFISGNKHKTYRLYATTEVETVPPYDTKETFFYQMQKFQIVDSENVVVAEIQDGVYTLYDTLPEIERDTMKQNITLFYVVLQASKIADSSGWGQPLFSW
jgi:hypothetical protein